MIEDALVAVQNEWNGWRTAMVRVADLQNIRWAQPFGARLPMIHAIVSCDRLVSGRIAHQCDGTVCHRLAVFVLKSHTQPAVFAELSKMADRAATVSILSEPEFHLTA